MPTLGRRSGLPAAAAPPAGRIGSAGQSCVCSVISSNRAHFSPAQNGGTSFRCGGCKLIFKYARINYAPYFSRFCCFCFEFINYDRTAAEALMEHWQICLSMPVSFRTPFVRVSLPFSLHTLRRRVPLAPALAPTPRSGIACVAAISRP